MTSVIVQVTDLGRDARGVELLPSNCTLYTSLEGENAGGSVKDHMVLGALTQMLERGLIKPGQRVAEASAGSTARSLAYYCHELGVKCALFVPDFLAPEQLEYLRSQKAEVHAVPLSEGFELYGRYCQDPQVIAFNQMKDISKRFFYHDLGRQISQKVSVLDVIVGAVGSGHSLIGTTEGLKSRPVVVTAEPDGFEVSGARNIASTRYGDDDPCVVSLFDQRVVLKKVEVFAPSSVGTSAGSIGFTDSFKLALSAALKVALVQHNKNIFILGAANYRLKKSATA